MLRLMLDRPYTAHQYIKDYYTNYCTVSSWLYEMASMPLAIDEIQIVPHDTEFNGDKAGFFEKLSFGFQRFCNSFTRDYRSISAVQDTQKTIRLWVNWGRDQAMILNSLIQRLVRSRDRNRRAAGNCQRHAGQGYSVGKFT